MGCLKPVQAWQAPQGDLVGPEFSDVVDFETGEVVRKPKRRPLSFSPVLGWSQLAVPCGKCDGCLMADARVWAIRAYHESTLRDKSCFLTLTYDEDHLPDDGKLSLRDLQLFFKRLRRRPDMPSVRYLACGEYGDLTRRPHYHALLFGVDFMDARAVSWRDEQFLHPVLQEVWQNGLVTHAPVNFSRCAYVAGYVTKKIGDPDVFRVMSKNPGLGAGWLSRYASSIRNVGGVVIDGQVLPVPPYYFDHADLSEVKQSAKVKALDSDTRLVAQGRHAHSHAARRVNAHHKISQRRGEL